MTASNTQERLTQMMKEFRQLDETLQEQISENVGLIASNRQYVIELEDIEKSKNDIRKKSENDSKQRITEREMIRIEMERLTTELKHEKTANANNFTQHNQDTTEFNQKERNFTITMQQLRLELNEKETYSNEILMKMKFSYETQLNETKESLEQMTQKTTALEAEIIALKQEKVEQTRLQREGSEIRVIKLETTNENLIENLQNEKVQHEATRTKLFKNEIEKNQYNEMKNTLQIDNEEKDALLTETRNHLLLVQNEKKISDTNLIAMTEKYEETKIEIHHLSNEIINLKNVHSQKEKLNIHTEKTFEQTLEQSRVQEEDRKTIEKDRQINDAYEKDKLKQTVHEQAIQLRNIQETMSTNGISRLLLPILPKTNEDKKNHRNNEVNHRNDSFAISHSHPHSATSSSKPSLSSSSSIIRNVALGTSQLFQPSAFDAATTGTTTNGLDLMQQSSLMTSSSHNSNHNNDVNTLFTLASTGTVEKRLLQAVALNESLNHQLIKEKDKNVNIKYQKSQARLLLQNVIDLFGALENELSSKFTELEDELIREDEERTRVIVDLENKLTTCQLRSKENIQKIQNKSNENIQRIQNKSNDSVIRTERRLNNLIDEHQRVQKRLMHSDHAMKEMTLELNQTKRNVIVTDRQLKEIQLENDDITIRMKACKEAEQAAYETLSKVRTRDSRHVVVSSGSVTDVSSDSFMNISQSGIGGIGGNGYKTKTTSDREIEEQQQVMIKSLRLQVSIFSILVFIRWQKKKNTKRF